MVEANKPGTQAAAPDGDSGLQQKTFEEILAESGYSAEQVRGIAAEIAQKKVGPSAAAEESKAP